MARRRLCVALLTCLIAVCRRADGPGVKLGSIDAARLAIVQEALSRVSGKPTCLFVDPAVTHLPAKPAASTEESWKESDPSPELMTLVGTKHIRPGSQCPPLAGDDDPLYRVRVGPLLVHKSGRVEAKMSHAISGYPTMESCVAEINDKEIWVVTCRVLWQA